MITDIPTPNDFSASGTDFLNLAWDSSSRLELRLEEAITYGSEYTNEPVPDDYWEAAQRPLATALSLVQQGTEFLLKGRIARVSPFLLVTSDWPKSNASMQYPFSSFKTIDAQDLPKAYDRVAQSPLEDDFLKLFESLRTRRNTIMHTVDKSLRISTRNIFEYILEISHHLVGPKQWVQIRTEWLNVEPDSVAYGTTEGVPITLVQEFGHITNVLGNGQLEKYFGFSKKRRKYLCPVCASAVRDHVEDIIPMAQLKPNKPASKFVYCFVCQSSSMVTRRDCQNEQCRGNVISVDDYQCLTCSNYQD